MPNYKKMTIAQLFEEYRKASAFTAEGLKKMAEIWVTLENKGADMSAYKTPLSRLFPDIANGSLLPETALLFGLMPAPIVEGVKSLVPEIQAQIAKNEGRVEILQHDGKTRNTRIQDLSQREVAQLIGGGKIRTVSEQRRHMAPAPAQRALPALRTEPEDDHTADDFDVFKQMTAEQHAATMRHASAVGLKPREWIVDVLVRSIKGFPGKPARRPVDRGQRISRELRA